jgi:hypothetical protein
VSVAGGLLNDEKVGVGDEKVGISDAQTGPVDQ